MKKNRLNKSAQGVLLSLVLVVSGAACGFKKDESPDNQSAGAAGVQITDPALNAKAMSILSSCVGCHSMAATLDGMIQSGWVLPGDANSKVCKRASDGSMSPSNPMSKSDASTICSWVKDGMKLVGPPPGAPVLNNPPPGVNAPPSGASDLAKSAFNILQVNCAGCHSSTSAGLGGINSIDNFQKMIDAGLLIPGNAPASQIYDSIAKGRMPPGGKVSATDLATLELWINTDLKSGGSQPPPTLTLDKTFKSISSLLLVPMCVSCHGATKAYDGIRCDSYAAVSKLVVKGAPTRSKLYTSCANGSMPQGGADLSAAQLKAMSDWITDGAQNN